mmetsp:Transcript_9620/g.17346  ORF Transcript_9620/g.17346 Transcript_9620/m.17346 type:complete len:432 (+) Transcript_9620:236-1531(+)
MDGMSRVRKDGRRIIYEVYLSFTHSTFRERVTILFFLSVPFLFFFLFLTRIVFPSKPERINFPESVVNQSLQSRHNESPFSNEYSSEYSLQSRVSLENVSTIDEIRAYRMQKRADAGLNPTPHVSLVAGCRDRSSFLLQALSSWLIALDEDDEIILVDWSTDDRLLSVSSVAELTGNDQRVLTVSVKDQDDWILSRAYNLAAKFASGLNLLKVDCDTVLEADFIQSHPLNESQGNSIFYQTSWKAARNENERHLNGVFYVNRQRFVEVHGYDERLTTYGWDDTDLYSRFKQSGMHSVHMNFEKLHHIQHGDDARGANQQSVDDNPQIETQAIEVAIHWMASDFQRFVFKHAAVTFEIQTMSLSPRKAVAPKSIQSLARSQKAQKRSVRRLELLNESMQSFYSFTIQTMTDILLLSVIICCVFVLNTCGFLR